MAIADAYIIIGSSNSFTDFTNGTDQTNYTNLNPAIYKAFGVAGVRPAKDMDDVRKFVSGDVRTGRYRKEKFHIKFQPFFVDGATGQNSFKDYLELTEDIVTKKYIWIETVSLSREGDPAESLNYWGFSGAQRHKIMVEIVEESVSPNFDKGIEELTWTVQSIPAEELP